MTRRVLATVSAVVVSSCPLAGRHRHPPRVGCSFAAVPQLASEGLQSRRLAVCENQDNHLEQTAFCAAISGDVRALKAAVQAGVSPNSADVDGFSLLILAAFYNQSECVSALLEAGADPDQADKKGMTAMHAAAQIGAVESVAILATRGANLNPRATGDGGATPLMRAAVHGCLSGVKAMLEAGADASLQDDEGWTAAQRAGAVEQPERHKAVMWRRRVRQGQIEQMVATAERQQRQQRMGS
mmetsp:Transcript_37562/g.91943  ORF Transcript_37562/g.91943 Transcript_37562/m.91943 type:complete len:242 (-) Transcript_37562:84-809(-)